MTGRALHVRPMDLFPYGVWLAGIGGFTVAAALALPSAQAQYDFTRSGSVIGHITDRTLTPIAIAQNGTSMVPVLLAYLAAYALAYAGYERIVHLADVRVAAVTFAAGALCAIAVPLTFTSDPYAYALYGLEAGPAALDPYAVQGVGLAHTAWGPALLAIFPDPHSLVRVCNYGPVFTLFYGGLATVFAHATLGAFLVAERIVGAVAIVATATIVALSVPAETASARVRSACAFAFHPLVMFEFVAFSHGDVFMLAALAATYWCVRRERFALAGACCAIAIAIRIVAVAALAALVVTALRRTLQAAGFACAGAAAATAVVCAVAYARFGEFGFGNAPLFNAYSAPLVALWSLFGGPLAPSIGFAAEALAGIALGSILLYRSARSPAPSALVWLPLAPLIAAPSFFAHYASWFVSVRALTNAPRFVRVARALSFSAPLAYVVHVDPFPAPGAPVLAQLATLAAVWIPPLVALTSYSYADPRSKC